MAWVISFGEDMKTLATTFPLAGLTTVVASFSSSAIERPLMKGINSSSHECLIFQNLLFFDSVSLHFPIQVASLKPQRTRGLRDIPVVFLQLGKNELLLVLGSSFMKS